MLLNRAEFEQRFAENRLRIALVGMSNIGKSYTGRRLATAYDFDLIEVDKLIWEALGQGSMADFAAWQGQPYSEGYAEREAKSIALETDATAKALSQQTGNAILDTTGSVIYTSELVQKQLTSNWYIIHISASEADVDRLKVQYFQHPKPLIWGDHYTRRPDQKPDEAILECYPKLLSSRAKAYGDLADRMIESELILDTNRTIEDIFEALKPAR